MRRLVALAPARLRPLLAGEAFGQLVRFVIAGLGVTLFASLVYLAFVYPLGMRPMAANAASYCAGFLVSYAVHRHWSFRAGAGGLTIFRFLAASLCAFALNSFWVWLMTDWLHLKHWTPVPAMIFATPIASFLLNRYWVFRAVGAAAEPA